MKCNIKDKNERYLAYELVTENPTNTGYMTFISRIKNMFVKLYPELISRNQQILDQNTFTEFVWRVVNKQGWVL